MRNRKKNRVLFLLIMLLMVTIGFALLSTTLKINGTAGIKSNRWDIHWDDTSINVTNDSVPANTPANVVDTEKKIVSFDVTLSIPDEFYEFTVDAKNYGTIAGAIEAVNIKLYKEDGVTLIDPIPTNLSYSFTHVDGSPVNVGEVLKPGESETYKFRIVLTDLADDEENIVPTIEIKYSQKKIVPVDYKDYDLLEEVYYNPVSNKWCDYYNYTTDGLCDRWLVLDKDDENDKLTLVYAEINNDYSVTMNNKEDQIDSITSNWSDELKITKKGQVSSTWSTTNDPISYDFTGKKARYLLGSEISDDLLLILGLHQEMVGGGLVYYIDDTASPVANGAIRRDTATTVTTMNVGPLDTAPQAPMLPVIEVTKGRKDLEDAVVKPVYLDPTNLSKKCSQKQVEDNVNSNGTPTEITKGCMKWYIFEETGNKYKLLLDHNTTALTYHPNYVYGSDEVAPGLFKLNELVNTDHWQATPRLITADEIAYITHISFDSQTSIASYNDQNDGHYYFEVNTFSRPNIYIRRYAWLVDNLKESRSYGAKVEDNNRYNYFDTGAYYGGSSPSGAIPGYWTSTIINGYSNKVWAVYNEGRFYDQSIDQTWSMGIRPVIEIDKSIVD